METVLSSIAREVTEAFPKEWETAHLPLIAATPLGDDPWTVADAFESKRDWTQLTGRFLDRHHGALTFLPDEAVCFYLPAFLIADLAGELGCANVVFHLIHGLAGKDRGKRLEGPFSNGQTWWDHAVERWSRLTPSQVRAVVRFLEHRASVADDASEINEALDAYWHRRLPGQPVSVDIGLAARRASHAKRVWTLYV